MIYLHSVYSYLLTCISAPVLGQTYNLSFTPISSHHIMQVCSFNLSIFWFLNSPTLSHPSKMRKTWR
ncbi:hypothetical protein F5884DRAFT_761486 [Xylogone sp. PMI_703]|nr:hypothetical protein F5884DRAFT_761486 [Xylogone sp. PMI_703]